MICETFMKVIRMEEAVTVFEMVSLWMNVYNSSSFHMEMCILTSIELDVYARSHAGAIGNGFTIDDDNARPHKARILENYLQNKKKSTHRMVNLSPGLNIIENV